MFGRLDLGCNPDLTSDVNMKPGKPCQIPGDVHFMCMDAPVSDDAGVGNRLFSETPDLAGEFDGKSGTPLFGSRGPIPGDRDSDSCHSVMCTSPPDPGGDDIIVTLLQSVLSGSGSSCRKFMSGSSHRKFAPGVCAGNCAGSFVIRVVLFAFVAAKIHFNPERPGLVQRYVSHTGSCPVAVGRDPVGHHRDSGCRLFSLVLSC